MFFLVWTISRANIFRWLHFWCFLRCYRNLLPLYFIGNDGWWVYVYLITPDIRIEVRKVLNRCEPYKVRTRNLHYLWVWYARCSIWSCSPRNLICTNLFLDWSLQVVCFDHRLLYFCLSSRWCFPVLWTIVFRCWVGSRCDRVFVNGWVRLWLNLPGTFLHWINGTFENWDREVGYLRIVVDTFYL
jgi:hypothetical protein